MCCVWTRTRSRRPARTRRGGGTARGSWGPKEAGMLEVLTGPHLRERRMHNDQLELVLYDVVVNFLQ